MALGFHVKREKNEMKIDVPSPLVLVHHCYLEGRGIRMEGVLCWGIAVAWRWVGFRDGY